MDLAVALRRENPDRTAAGIRRILRAQLGWSPDERTLQRHFVSTARENWFGLADLWWPIHRTNRWTGVPSC
jgi:hypothetical protein